jgi:peptidoglycan/xylan/chitin deacetylase (PgdA/CDA1 family)/carbon monoxide dehydrogenase subunit G
MAPPRSSNTRPGAHPQDRSAYPTTGSSLRSITRHLMLSVLVLALALIGLPLQPAEAVTPCSKGTVALTFDDGPHGTYTPKVLDILKGRKAKATFFQVGSQVASYPKITRRAHNEGHRVANHTWKHENLTKLTNSAIRDTLRRTNRRIADTGAATPTLVRPPYGATNSRVRTVISDLGMFHVLWTVDPQDWRSGRSASTITNLVLNNLHNGANILLHDGVANSKNTVAALPKIIDGIRSRGYCIGTLSKAGKVTPPVPAASIGNTEVTEGAAGKTTTAYLTVRLSEPTSRSVSFAYATADGTALAGKDYTATSGTLTFSVGQTSRRIAVKVKGDNLDEWNEKFTVKLSKPSGATISRATGTVTILDDDPAPTVRVDDASVTEGAAGTTATVKVPVRLSAPSGKTITVGYVTADGTAIAGSDYTATSGTLTFSPGQTSKTVNVVVRGDDLDEPNETFTVRLKDPYRTSIARGTATVTIVDDDPAPTVRIDDVSGIEGAAGTTTKAKVPVRLSAPSGRTVTVYYATADGTATAGSDYTATSGTLTFSPGQTTKYVEVAVHGDDVHEGDETFTMTLTSPVNTSILRGTATVTIVDDDPAPPPEE